MEIYGSVDQGKMKMLVSSVQRPKCNNRIIASFQLLNN